MTYSACDFADDMGALLYDLTDYRIELMDPDDQDYSPCRWKRLARDERGTLVEPAAFDDFGDTFDDANQAVANAWRTLAEHHEVLLKACRNVLANCEQGDLASALNKLEACLS